MITSTSNAKVKQVIAWRDKAKERRKDRSFLVEGWKMFHEAPEELIREVYVSQDALAEREKGLPKHASALTEDDGRKALQEKLERTGYEVVAPEVFAKMSDTQTPQGILAVLQQPGYDLSALLHKERALFIILENLQDPGNLGTILRTAEGAGVTGVIMNRGTVDLFNPKVIRSTMGSIYRVPFVVVDDLPEVMEELHASGIHTYAAHLAGETYYESLDFTASTAFLIGNEGNGLTRELADLAEQYLKIPMEGQVESLNASVAAALLMYEAHRQRRMSR